MSSWCRRTRRSRSRATATRRFEPCAVFQSAVRRVCRMDECSRRRGPSRVLDTMAVRTPPDDDVPIARLTAMAFETLIEDLHRRLAKRGWHDVRPTFGFVLHEARRRPL